MKMEKCPLILRSDDNRLTYTALFFILLIVNGWLEKTRSVSTKRICFEEVLGLAALNEIMLITYADSLGKNLEELKHLLQKHLRDVVGGVHILPFYPSSADRGFAPIDYSVVDPAFGTYDDIMEIGQEFELMVDFMVNHISCRSRYFQEFREKKDQSRYKDMFIRYRDFWPGGEPTEEDIGRIYRRKPRAPYVVVDFPDGTVEKVWCTFDEEQIDLNVGAEVTRDFIRDSLHYLAEKRASIIRLDAFAYAIKKLGTNCFFVEPEVWELLEYAREVLKPYDVEILPEIHEHYTIQLELAKRGYWVYDFALPMLLLYSLYSGDNRRLLHWLKICPHKQYTTLDTHDGIGVVDVKDLLSEEEIEQTKDYLFSRGANVKRIYNSMAYNNLDVYQLNCTYYSALGNDDDAYLLARAIQFFTPGIPQVYYVGLLAGENDIQLLEETKVGRNINRHYYSLEEAEKEMQRPVVKQLFELMRFRNSYPAFDGTFSAASRGGHRLRMTWHKEPYRTVLECDLKTHQFSISYLDPNTREERALVL
jgi:sucrose phosphorylase